MIALVTEEELDRLWRVVRPRSVAGDRDAKAALSALGMTISRRPVTVAGVELPVRRILTSGRAERAIRAAADEAGLKLRGEDRLYA